MYASRYLPRIVERVQHQLHAHLRILAVQLRETHVMADQQSAFDAFQVKGDELISGRVKSLVAAGAEAFVD